MSKTILTCAVTGNLTKPEMTLAVPMLSEYKPDKAMVLLPLRVAVPYSAESKPEAMINSPGCEQTSSQMLWTQNQQPRPRLTANSR